MLKISHFAAAGCLIAMFVLPLFPRNTAVAQIASLNEAKTVADAEAYLNQRGEEEVKKFRVAGDQKALQMALGKLLLETSDKIFSLAKEVDDKKKGYSLKAQGLALQESANVEGAKGKLEALLKELDASADFKQIAAQIRFAGFMKGALEGPMNADEYGKFKAELKTWINKKTMPAENVIGAGVLIANSKGQDKNAYGKEMVEFLKSAECTIPDEEKKGIAKKLEDLLRGGPAPVSAKLNMGGDPELYGKTIDDKDFDWKSLRGKYVLVKFTATWCGPCKGEIPGMLEAYEKYKDKGLEIVSVYVWERGGDPVQTVKEFVEKEKIKWIILSEALTEKGGKPAQGTEYSIQGVPTMVLVDKEGKVIMTNARGGDLKTKLEEIFKK